MKTLKVTTESPEETRHLGTGLAKALKGGEVILLCGRLGAGKTCLTQGIAWGLGIQEYVRSPTFVLISEYQGRLTLYHMDLYRLDDVMEIEELGLDDYIYRDGVSVIEWAEKALSLLPQESLLVNIEFAGADRRVFTLEARGKRHKAILDQLAPLGLERLAASKGG